MLDGRLERARRLADEALTLAARRGWSRTWPVGLAEGALSAVALERNQLAEAERASIRCGEAAGARLRRPAARGGARPPRAPARRDGRPEAALEALEARASCSAAGRSLPALRGLMSGLRRDRRAPPWAADERRRGALTRSATAAAAAPPRTPRRWPGCGCIAGDPTARTTRSRPWLDGDAAAFGPTRAELWLLDALAHDAAADEAGAAAVARARARRRRAARRCGGRSRARRAPVAALLRRQLRRGTAHRSLVDDLLRELDSRDGDGAARALLLEPLSEREAAVLRFLPTMMSNHEIAAELFVSVNTVKTHLKAIYRKLDVADRREAVRRARDLELLAP